MLHEFNITDDDIAYSENILLPHGHVFDNERRTYIKNFTTIDLQAVPGSGKTTALLAKLLILERKLPFESGAGILVLSHTNAAVDEIKSKIEIHCPKLFSYPNFIGTIQSFTDKFLAVPYYGIRFNKKPIRIDDEIYHERVAFFSRLSFSGFTNQEQNNAKRFLRSGDIVGKIRFSRVDDRLSLTNGYNGNILTFSKPRGNTRPSNYFDWTLTERDRVKAWLFKFKKHFFDLGVLCFDDAYFLAFEYLRKFPLLSEVLQKRFSLVFVDETQDMDFHQHELLEKIFFVDGNSQCIYQRIGDKNQAIYGGSNNTEHLWNNREIVLSLNQSKRLSPRIANIVNRFALHRGPQFEIVGTNSCDLKPCIFKYSATTIENVIPAFLSYVESLQRQGRFPLIPSNPIKIVAWNTSWNNDEARNANNVRLTDYFLDFSRDKHKVRIDHTCLKSYLYFSQQSGQKLASIRNSLVNAILKAMRLENIMERQDKFYSRQSLFSTIKDLSDRQGGFIYEKFQTELYKWSIGLISNRIDDIWNDIKAYIPEFFQLFDKQPQRCLEFINLNIDFVINSDSEKVSDNKVFANELEVEITTVHSVKGQTHSATLYLETSYYNQHESQRLFNQIMGSPFNDNRVRHRESAKMAYVALSRPTNLLCLAIQSERFNIHLSEIDLLEWDIVEV
jgi:DNA helicase-2/ATP-dependent DNA helicase PcrA